MPQALRLISREMVKLRSDPPEGVRVVVDEEDLTNMEGWVQGPGELVVVSLFAALFPSSLPFLCQGQPLENKVLCDWT